MSEQLESNSLSPAIADVSSAEVANTGEVHSEPAEVVSPEMESTDAANQEPEWFKKRLGRQEKKYERTISELRKEVDQLKGFGQPGFPAGRIPEAANQDPVLNANHVFDPYTGQFIDANSDTGRILQTIERREHAQKAMNERQAHLNARQVFEAEQKRLDDEMFNSFEDAKDRYGDFEDKIHSDAVPFTKAMVDALKISHNPGELAYYLASNPKEVQRLSRLHPLQMAREVNRHALEMSRKPVSKAPAPIQPVTEAPKSVPHKSPSRMSYEEMKAARKEEVRGQRKR